ncbi:MAG TPA: nucleotide exchange factor GrpE [Solirubrobacteraceae bacterium]|nr:nucleotide exchange factor GrpE [Solirubrobacteraceae bacterium]
MIDNTESHATGVQGTRAAPDDGEIAAPPVLETQAERPGDGEAASTSAEQSVPGKGMDGDAAAIEGELDEMVKTAAERDEYLALAQRTQADFENYRKRVARDAAQAQDRGVAKLAKELLPALDNLDRAIEAAEAEDPLLAGVRLVRSELGAALARLGIEAFVPLGEQFDPNLHEAVAQQPVEGAASGTVAEVFQSGYRMGESIVRPARVLVAA